MRGWLLTFTPALVMLVSSAAAATDLADFHPVAGPTTVDLGKDLAALNVGADYYFVEAANTRKLMEALGNPPSNAELGTIIPKSNADWFIVLEYEETDYVSRDRSTAHRGDGRCRRGSARSPTRTSRRPTRSAAGRGTSRSTGNRAARR